MNNSNYTSVEIKAKNNWVNAIKNFLSISKSVSCNLNSYELADIKDYSIYTLNELNYKLSNFKCHIQMFEGNIMAKFESECTILTIKYNAEGIYLSKIKELWK